MESGNLPRRRLHILLLAEGDPDSQMGSGSGTPASLATGLRNLGHIVTTKDIEIGGMTRAYIAARTWSPIRARWVAKYHLSKPAFDARSLNAQRAVKSTPGVDAVLQYGATFSAVQNGVPVFLFCDSNTRFSASEPTSWGSALSRRGLAEAVSLEGALYSEARAIFTMSRYIAESFVDDFAVDENSVVAVGAGPNANPIELLAIERNGVAENSSPTILFIGREFERKGGDILLESFRRIRRTIPDARLVIIGPRDPITLPEGAEWLGFLDRTSAMDWAKLKDSFSSASVFTLPARHEPFGLVVLEAMYAGLPVVATRIGALEEMVLDEVTGRLVPPSNVDELTDALLSVLTHPSSHMMGLAGRERALSNYSWSRVTETISSFMLDSIN